MAGLSWAQEILRKAMQNLVVNRCSGAKPVTQSLVAVCGLLVWLRLGGALTYSYVSSQCAFGIAGAWQLAFAEKTPPRFGTRKKQVPLEPLGYAASRGIPILLTYLIVGFLALQVVAPALHAAAFWTTAKFNFYLGLTNAWSIVCQVRNEGVTVGARLVVHIGLTAGAALIEELFWRGYVQPIWCAACVAYNKPERLGIVLQALAFGAAHVATDLSLGRLATSLPGYWFGHAAFRTGGLMAPTVLHVGCNLAASLLHLWVSTRS